MFAYLRRHRTLSVLITTCIVAFAAFSTVTAENRVVKQPLPVPVQQVVSEAAQAATSVVHEAVLMSSLPLQSALHAQDHCQWIWLTLQCYLVWDMPSSKIIGKWLEPYTDYYVALAAGAGLIMCSVATGVVAALCGAALAIFSAKMIDAFKWAAATNGCVELHWAPVPYFGGVPINVYPKKYDGGWCHLSGSGFDCINLDLIVDKCPGVGGGGGGGGGGSW